MTAQPAAATTGAPRPLPAGWRTTAAVDGTKLAWRLDAPAAALTKAGRVRAARLAVVLTNGITCDDVPFKYVWRPLSQQLPVLRWHYRGHGLSDHPADEDRIRVEHNAEDLHAVLEAAGVRRALLVGHSYGVQVVGEAYRVDPEPIEGLVAVAGAYGTPLGLPFGRNPGALLFETMRRGMASSAAKKVFRTAVRSPIMDPLVRLGRFITAEAGKDDMREWFEHLAGRDVELMMRMMRAMQEHTIEDLLPDIEVPVVAMPGAKDWPTPPRLGRRMVDRVPDGRLVVVEGGSHMLPIERPEVVIEEILRLADRVEG